MTYSNSEKKEKFSLVEEGVNSYETREINNNQFEIKIVAPMKFKNIWLVKLDELETSLEEMESWESNN